MKIETVLHQVQLVDSDTPKLDAEILLAYVLGKNRTYLKTWGEQSLDTAQLEEFQKCIARRQQGEPIAYITGEQEFWSLSFKVNEATLIPRPDTETLVEKALHLIEEHAIKTLLDMGTGSGAIALALADSAPNLQVVASDLSPEALAIAQENARNLNVKNVSFVTSDWFENISEQFDMIVSNPPYIEDNDPHLKHLGYEPKMALVSGEDGLDDIRHIIAQSKNHLRSDGWLLLEHGFDQAKRIQALMQDNGFEEVQTIRDLSGLDRVTLGKNL